MKRYAPPREVIVYVNGFARFVCAVSFVALLAAPPAVAAAPGSPDSQPSSRPRESEARPDGTFPRGAWTMQVYGSYAKSFCGENEHKVGGTVGVGYYFRDNVSLNAEFSGYH